MAGGERNPKTVRRGVREAVDRVGPEIVILALLAVGDHRRAGRLEPRDGVGNGVLVQRIEFWVGMISRRRNRLDQAGRPRNTADRFGRNDHQPLSWRSGRHARA